MLKNKHRLNKMYLTVASVLAVIHLVRAGSVLDAAKANGATTLYNLVVSADLKPALDTTKDITLFAPSDAAVSSLPASLVQALTSNKTLLQEVLKFHVVPSLAPASSIKNDQLLPTLAGNAHIRTNIYKSGQVVTAEGSVVTKADIQADNGIVHIIDRVMYPIPTQSIPVALNLNNATSTIGYLILKADLVTALSAQSFTVFAPSNDAVNKLPGHTYVDLLVNFTQLITVLKNHVVPGTIYSAGLSDGQKLTTLAGTQLEVKINSGSVTVGGAKVTWADVGTTNGVIHLIDSLLIPAGHGDPGVIVG
ncbi:unnamed protein product [Lymnaea stagnalis]|uniref:FAS1 domain-containing protein n=1 Tax=Lymnaea stagnalis TaxID=6523 RepID=A0AAV2HBQ1_LYMST